MFAILRTETLGRDPVYYCMIMSLVNKYIYHSYYHIFFSTSKSIMHYHLLFRVLFWLKATNLISNCFTYHHSGSALAEFLTDGDPHTDTTKTVDQLQKFNPKGVEQCRKLATHYSKQLFEIYKNEEDPFFHP